MDTPPTQLPNVLIPKCLWEPFRWMIFEISKKETEQILGLQLREHSSSKSRKKKLLFNRSYQIHNNTHD